MIPFNLLQLVLLCCCLLLGHVVVVVESSFVGVWKQNPTIVTRTTTTRSRRTKESPYHVLKSDISTASPRCSNNGLGSIKCAIELPTSVEDIEKDEIKKNTEETEETVQGSITIDESDHIVDTIQKKYGMPWKSSIDPTYCHDELFYMPFWEWQIQFMKGKLQNIKIIPTMNRFKTKDLTYIENSQRKQRMITLCFSSNEYRLIRMTLLDAGCKTQVFTSLWYPRTNLPVLGIDLLQFNNQKKHLTVVDFQPIHNDDESSHDLPYEHLLESIRSLYPSLQHRMSNRFYDENQFFSPKMLLGKGDDPNYVWDELMPAYKAYVQTHLDLVTKNIPSDNADVAAAAAAAAGDTDYEQVLKRHKAYDDYSSVRDPAHGLLKSAFGESYADEFVYDVLFPLSDGPESK